MISLECPKCSGQLTADEKRDFLFCEFCGHKILLGNKKEYTFTYHEINDAEIKKQEVTEKIKLRELKDKRITFWVELVVSLTLLGLLVGGTIFLMFIYPNM